MNSPLLCVTILIPAPQGVNLVGCRRIFRIKRKSDDYVDRFKARLVEKGYNQPPGLDYLETFSHVVKPATIRTVLSIAVMQGWSLRQMDVNNAFLHGNLDEDVFMSQLPSFVNSTKPGFVCKLKKSIYGLKQAPRAWYSALKQALLDLGFTNSTSDTSLIIYRHDSIILYMLVYVDDLVLTSNNAAFLSHIISKLSNRFSIKDLRPLHFFMGIEVIATSAGLMISQHKYIRYLLARTNMDGAKDVSTPLSTNIVLRLSDGTSLVDSTFYRQIIGSLQYLSLTRTDINFAVNKLSQFMRKPTATHWSATKRLLRYLKNTIFHGLLLCKDSSPTVSAFTDADWAGNIDDHSSTSAYVIFFVTIPSLGALRSNA